MSANGYSDDLRERLSSAPADKQLSVITIEIRHPAFDPPAARYVNDTIDLTATLEDDAPLDAGETVAFTATRFDAILPESNDQGLPTCSLEISNVAGELMPWLQASVSVPAAIELSVREYLRDDPSEPGHVIHGLNIKKTRAELQRVKAQAGFEDVLNLSGPRRVYLVKDFSTLAR
jgi:hypothetical protein